MVKPNRLRIKLDFGVDKILRAQAMLPEICKWIGCTVLRKKSESSIRGLAYQS